MGKIISGANLIFAASLLFPFCCLLFICCFYEDILNDKKERTVASARCVLEELKKMEIVHELEKGNIKIKKKQ